MTDNPSAETGEAQERLRDGAGESGNSSAVVALADTDGRTLWVIQDERVLAAFPNGFTDTNDAHSV